MNSARVQSVARGTIAVWLAVVFALPSVAFSQRLPGSEPARPRPTPRPSAPRRVTTAFLIVVTQPGAVVAANGKELGRAARDGQFEKQIAAGKYTVTVTAGAEYLPYTASVTLKPGAREVVSAMLTPATGAVEISLPRLDGATLLVDGTSVAHLVRDGGVIRLEARESPGVEPSPLDVSFDAERETILVRRLAPGSHTFGFRHPDYAAIEKVFVVTAGAIQLLPIRAEAVGALLEIETEFGASVYIDGALVGEARADGRFSLEGVAPGEHQIRIAKRGFQPMEERRTFASSKVTRLALRLDPAITTAAFEDTFDENANRWSPPPSGWTVSAGSLRVEKSPTVGLVTGIVYKDFVWSFNLKLLDGSGAAWVVRAKDSSNYYLFHLSGPKSRLPNRFLTYVVQDGKLDVTTPAANPVTVTSTLAPGQEYYVEVTVLGNSVTTRITPLATGIVENLGTFRDANGTFAYGGFGFRTVENESFAVDELYADPPR
jgi:hypothetical protein